MQSRRAPLFVFFSAFFTFLIAFALLLVMLKPAIDKKRAASAEKPAAPTTASVAPGPARPAAPPAKDGTKTPKATDRPAKDGPWEVECAGRVVDVRGEVPRDVMVHLLAPSTDKKSDRFHHLASAPVDATGHFKLAAKVTQPAVVLQGSEHFLLLFLLLLHGEEQEEIEDTEDEEDRQEAQQRTVGRGRCLQKKVENHV